MENITDQIIRQAMERGEFDNLEGKGKPLTHLDEYANTPPELRAGFTLLKNSGYLPPEAELLKEIDGLKERLAACKKQEERNSLKKTINDKQLQLSLMLERMRDK